SAKRPAGKGAPGKAVRKANDKGIDMSIKRIKEIVDLMNDNNLSEVEVEQEGLKVRLIKTRSGAVEQVNYIPAAPVQMPAVSQPAVSQQEQPKNNRKEVLSPMVGTFYRSPSPETAPYVNVGDVIQKGDVLCIVEAMKLMNEIKAEFGGRIAEVLVENAEPVEFGQALFLIEPL
ncbi:MAG TPA: acetyl-CoA carboxylase biotin carboxyl carrier protein, partial [Candidatus Omnitrophota bacterium]|nr:acetyl-CoA carboxylase biotin carboxyl carrier protein [Candidatus Omnitrophota bacterium]